MWSGDYSFLLRQLILKDFRIRYRNMSLGVFWSLVNPLVMMSVYTYVFTKIFTNPIPYFTVHLLSALISYNFFSYAWVASTTSLLDNVGFVKRISTSGVFHCTFAAAGTARQSASIFRTR
jgi:ABC-type polysaccharide/polyol phosphate export permease